MKVVPPETVLSDDEIYFQQLYDISASSVCFILATCRDSHVLAVPILHQRIGFMGRCRYKSGLLLDLRLAANDMCVTEFIRYLAIGLVSWVNDLVVQQLEMLLLKSTQLETLTCSRSQDIAESSTIHHTHGSEHLHSASDFPRRISTAWMILLILNRREIVSWLFLKS